MSVKTLYPHTVSQSSGSSIQSFNNLSNVKNNNNTYAKTNQIASKTGTKKTPAAITATNFKANIPAGSKINSVTVEYAADYEGNISIGKPTINILNITGDNKKGKALTKTVTKSTAKWTGNHIVANMNSANFGVKISFPSNTKANTGYVKVKYIRIIIDYSEPNFTVTAKKVSGTYHGDEFLVKCTLSNVNKTKGTSNVNIGLPSGLGFIRDEGPNGYVVSISGSNNRQWITNIDGGSSASVVLRLYPDHSGSFTITLKESATGHTSSLTLLVVDKPVSTGAIQDIIDTTPEIQIVDDTQSVPEATPTPVNVLQVDIDEEFSLDLTFDGYTGSTVKLYAYSNDVTYENTSRTNKIYIYSRSQGQWAYRPLNSYDSYNSTWLAWNYDLNNGLMENLFKISNSGYYTILIYSSDDTTLLKKVMISVKPNNISTPYASLVKLGQEELNRLGDSVVYTAQSFIKLVTNEPFVRDWGKNFKIGVFNNRIESNIQSLATFGTFSSNSVTATLNIPSPAIGYDITTDNDVTTTENVSSIVFTKSNDNSNVTVKIDFLDNQDNIVATGEYFINFDDESVIAISNDYDPTNYSELSDETLIDNAAYWSKILSNVNAFASNSVDFPYDKTYPVYIIITGDYHEGNPFNNDIKFSEPCIVESDVYNGKEPNGNYPTPILNLVDNTAEEASEIKLSSFEESTHVIVYNPELPENYGTNDELAVRGIEITADIDFTDDLTLFAKLKVRQDNQYYIGNRSVIINNSDDSLVIGGKYDTWGLNISDLINLDRLELELGVNNVLESSDADMLLKNIQLIIYTNSIPPQPYGVIVEDQNVAWYGMDVTNVEMPFGRKSETKYLNIEGSDTNVAYRQNIREKTVKIYFDLDSCDLTESTEQLLQLAKLFTNKRDEINSPIPKSIRFAHIPNKIFYYILEDTFDTDIMISDYKGSIELTIPDGTAFDVEDTVTNINGYVDGIAAINPIIVLTHITNTQMTISELVSSPNQVFKINQENLTNGVTFATNDVITINCLTRTCSILKEGASDSVDITEAVDFNSDWFKLHGEFEFKSENCVIQTITYNTRS